MLPVMFMSAADGQKNNKKIIITGIITDANKKPVEGAAIFIDKINTNSISDNNGYYKVKAKKDAGTISAMSVFHGIVDAVIDGRTEINFVFSESALTNTDPGKNAGKDDNVNIGYGSQNKNDLGMPVDHIDGRKSKYASYSDIYSMIKGEVTGVTVRGKSIVIRGSNSVNTTSEALLIVDGIKVTTIQNIAPQMVKSIEVLKGPSAAIYGSRGTNGVILITLIR